MTDTTTVVRYDAHNREGHLADWFYTFDEILILTQIRSDLTFTRVTKVTTGDVTTTTSIVIDPFHPALTAEDETRPLAVGDILDGFSHGQFGRDNYGPNLCVGITTHDGERVATFHTPSGSYTAIDGSDLNDAIDGAELIPANAPERSR